MQYEIMINNRRVGQGHRVYIVAEVSANHNQSFDEAVKIIKAAREAGADAVKLQTYTPDTMTIDCDNEYFRIGEGSLWSGKNLYQLYSEAYTPWEWFPKLKAVADDIGIDFFSTPFDSTAVDLLQEIGVPVFKIASFELVDHALIKYIAKTGKPIIMSTGMASLSEIEESVSVLREAGCDQLALLKCTSAYPAVPSEINLRTIPHLSAAFDVPVGLSDHTLGIAVPVASVALGACIIEKHFTLSRSQPSPDSAFSLEPHEFKEMVALIRIAEEALGSIHYGTSEKEKQSKTFRRSLFIVQNVRKGEVFTIENVRSIRPGYGLHTRFIDEVLGKKATCMIKRGTPLSWEMLEKENE